MVKLRSPMPSDWELSSLEAISEFSQYGLNSSSGEGKEYPMLRMNNLQNGGIDTSDLAYIRLSDEEYKKFGLNSNDLLVNRTNSYDLVGKTALFNLPGEYVFASYLVRFRLNENKVDPKYVDYYFNFYEAKHFLQTLATKGVSQANINPTILKKRFMIPLPSLPEQRAIAAILGTWDRAIALTEQRLAAAEQRKKALMQQLLTGRVRFPEFVKSQKMRSTRLGIYPEDWSIRQLSDVVEIRFSNVDKKCVPDEQPVRLCNYLDVFNNDYIHNQMRFMTATATESEIQKFGLQVHDVIITKDSETAEEIAEPCVVVEKLDNVICGYHLAILRPQKGLLTGPFLKDTLRSFDVHNQFVRFANGITRFGLTMPVVDSILIPVPPFPEQHRIAAVLNACDHEIDLLRRKRDALQQQKKGLMQRLLTGRVRVKI